MFKRLFGGRGATGKPQGSGTMHGTRPGAGPGRECVCPCCGCRMVFQVAQPCDRTKCPDCGSFMVRAKVT